MPRKSWFTKTWWTWQKECFQLQPLFLYPQKLPFDTSDENCQYLFLMTNSVACISVNLFLVEIPLLLLTHQKSPYFELCKMLLVTLHQIPISRDVPVPLIFVTIPSSVFIVINFILCHLFHVLQLNEFLLATYPCLSFHHCLVCRMCQIAITATWWFAQPNISRLEHQILIVQKGFPTSSEFLKRCDCHGFLNSRIVWAMQSLLPSED